MVRLGLGLYGLSPFENESPESFGLRPAMRLVSRVANVKRVPAGQGVGYGLRYHTTEDTYLGLVPMGYADGIPRAADNAPVSINGKTYRVRGTVAMDQFVVDLGPDVAWNRSSGLKSSSLETAARRSPNGRMQPERSTMRS